MRRYDPGSPPSGGVEISIEYRLIESGARWAVYDVVLDGVSLVSNYRSQFNTIIRTSSFADLLVKLRSKQIEAHAIPRTSRGCAGRGRSGGRRGDL